LLKNVFLTLPSSSKDAYSTPSQHRVNLFLNLINTLGCNTLRRLDCCASACALQRLRHPVFEQLPRRSGAHYRASTRPVNDFFNQIFNILDLIKWQNQYL
ncbi:hypothetical protein, partial [Ketobacter sp. GenoA1]